MKISFQNQSVSGSMELSDSLTDFFLWLAKHRLDESAISLLMLLSEHDREIDVDEKLNIRRTIDEIMRG